jgi:hypothetical protein
MARWKLMTPVYLNCVIPAKWEYSETSRTTGKPVRKTFNVPTYLDPKEPSDWTKRWGFKDDQDGEIIVCQPGKGDADDIEFLGDPTPDMTPIDDEAKIISASFAERWRFKAEGAPISYSQSLVDEFQSEMAEVQTKPASVQIEGLAELVAAMSAQAAATQALLSTLTPQRRI